jgi:hypothetical protein
VTGFDAQQSLYVRPPVPDRPSAKAVLALFGICAGSGALLSLFVGWLWVTVANPPAAPLAPGGGVFLGEEALNRQSGVTLWFFMLGVGFGAAVGLVVGWIGQRYGWVAIIAVLLLCVVATILTRYLGVHLYGPDPRSEAADAKVGDLIQLDVSVDTWVAYLGWPIGGLVGVLGAIAGWRHSSISPLFTDNSHNLG